MMRQFCVLFLQWSRYQGQTCSQGTEYTSYDCMDTVRTCTFTPVVFTCKSLMGHGRMMMVMRFDADKKRPPGGDLGLVKDLQKPPQKQLFYFFIIITVPSHALVPLNSSFWIWIYIFNNLKMWSLSSPRNKKKRGSFNWVKTTLPSGKHRVLTFVEAPAPSIYNQRSILCGFMLTLPACLWCALVEIARRMKKKGGRTKTVSKMSKWRHDFVSVHGPHSARALHDKGEQGLFKRCFPTTASMSLYWASWLFYSLRCD